jgi:hypothetical protein
MKSAKLILSDLWEQFWINDYIKGTTVNRIEPPSLGDITFLHLLYVILAVILVIIFFFIRQPGRKNLFKAAVISFIITGTLFAFRMDYEWYAWCRKDSNVFGRLPVDDRINIIEQNTAFAFSNTIKKVMAPGEKVRLFTDKDFYSLKIRYHLLPVKVSKSGSYIAVYMDNSIGFDPLRGILSKNGAILAEHVVLVRDYGNNRCLYRISGTGDTR